MQGCVACAQYTQKEVYMSSIINSDNGLSTLFSSLNTSSSSISSTGLDSSTLLADYASIKNGSYGKLVKAYYKKNKENVAESEEETTAVKADKQVKTYASSLKDAASALADNKSLFEKITVKDEDGNEKEDYNWDAISDKLKSFIDSYNSTVKSSIDSDTKGVLSSTLNMIKGTYANKGMLSSVGITVGEDNTLSLDEDKLKSSNIGDLKSLFSGSGSLAYSVATSASTIATRAANAVSSGTTYSSSASYSNLTNSSSVLDTYL